ncbi:MAG TPA: sodium:solute symporter family protein [Vicinamibacterales bacterium]|nr:sodium:solute symporter family protein [Vicinamibacterales bacterium]
MIAAAVVFAYLAVVLGIGIFGGRSAGHENAEGYFLAGRAIGPVVFLLSLFGTNMTAFSILGASGHAFANGIVTYGLMASSSALVIPVGIFVIGTRLWALGKRHGFMTPVQMFRDRWECGHIGTVIFLVQAVLLIPYIVIAVMGGGTTLRAVSGGLVPYWLGGAIVSMVVMGYVFFGGMRGTAWVNTFQTILFLSFGAIAVAVIARGMGGFGNAIEGLLASPATAPLLTRERVSPLYFFSYTFIPLSSLAFPHIGIFCLTAKRLSHFRRTVVLYPICMFAIWLPSVFLGVVANKAVDLPPIRAKVEARATLATQGPSLTPERRSQLRATASGDDVILKLVEGYAPLWLASLLGAAVMAAVMASDSQILALSTMFTEDVFAFYGGQARFGPSVQVQTGRVFVILLTIVAYAIALTAPQSIFDIASQYAFAGYSALSPLLIAALFWKRSTKWGALAVSLWTAASVLGIAVLQWAVPAPAPGAAVTVWAVGGVDVITRIAAGTTVLGLLPVVPMTLVSALLMFVVSSVTQGSRPSPSTRLRYNV